MGRHQSRLLSNHFVSFTPNVIKVPSLIQTCDPGVPHLSCQRTAAARFRDGSLMFHAEASGCHETGCVENSSKPSQEALFRQTGGGGGAGGRLAAIQAVPVTASNRRIL